jgi:CRP/FNR family cyclic AMP-dependent transcriptional regulator
MEIPKSSPEIFDRILMLKRSDVFSAVTTENLYVVAQELVETHYMPGERVFDINDQGDHMYVIQSGKIGISIDPTSKNKNFIALLGEGECFGEMGMLDDLPRSATAHVVEESVLLVLEKSRLTALITHYPELALGILRSLSLRLRSANQLSDNSTAGES